MPLVLIKSDPKAREKPCIRCGYSLRKILDARRCPECGLSVWISLNNNDSLEWSRPSWLRAIAIGAFVMAAAQMFVIVTAAAMMLRWWNGRFWLISGYAGIYLIALHGGMIMLGVPEKRYPDQLKLERWFLVTCGVLGVLVGAVLLAGAMMGHATILYFGVYFWPAEIALLLGSLATVLYARHLARRLGRHRLAKILLWLLALPALKLCSWYPFWGVWLGWRYMSHRAIPLLFIPASMVIFFYLAMGFRKAASEADANWARESAT